MQNQNTFIDSKLFQWFKILTIAEFKALGLYLQSPFLNTNQRLIVFYELVKKHAPFSNSFPLTKQQLFEQLFPMNTPYHDKKMRALMSNFSKQIEAFLAHQTIKEQPALKNKLLVKALSHKKKIRAFERATEQQIQTLKAQPVRDLEYFLDQFLLHKGLYFHPETTTFQKSATRLQHIQSHLDHFYALAKLRLGMELLSRNRILGETNQVRFWKETLPITQVLISENSLLNLYFQLVQLDVETTSLTTIQTLRQHLENLLPSLNLDEQETILRNLLNFLTRLSPKWGNAARRESLALYKLGLQHHLFTQNQQLPHTTFINIAIIAANLKEWFWCESFIQQYAESLPENFRTDTVFFSKAYIAFGQARFLDTLQLLDAIQNNSLIFTLRVKPLYISCFYELSLVDTSYGGDFLWYRLEAFEKALQRTKKLPTKTLKLFFHFTYFVKKMIKILSEGKPFTSKFEALHTEIQQTNTTMKAWLLKKTATF